MNTANFDKRREHRQTSEQDFGIMIVIAIAASGSEGVHDMTVTQTYQRDGAHTAQDNHEGANMAHVLHVRSSLGQDNTTSGMNTATLHFDANSAECNNNENERP